MVMIKGTIQRGAGQSQNTIKEQMPFFRDCFPEVADCKVGTLNIRLEKPVVVTNPDFTTRSLPWHPALKLAKSGEMFQFVRIRLTLEGQKPVNAWIYRAQFSPYREDPFLIEVLAPALSISGSPVCAIEFLTKHFEGIIVAAESKPAINPPASGTPPAKS